MSEPKDSSNEPIEVKLIAAASDGMVIVTPEKCERIREILRRAALAEKPAPPDVFVYQRVINAAIEYIATDPEFDAGNWSNAYDELHSAVKDFTGEQTAAERPAEFCLYCGSGIGKFRRNGEGTCPKCDPERAAAPPVLQASEYCEKHAKEREFLIKNSSFVVSCPACAIDNAERAAFEKVVYMLQGMQTDAVNMVSRGNVIDRVRALADSPSLRGGKGEAG